MILFTKSARLVLDDEDNNLLNMCDQHKYTEFSNARKIDAMRTVAKLFKENNINYFCYGRLLEGCIHYGEFGEPSGAWDLAVLREEYDKAYSVLENAEYPENVYFSKYYDDKKKLPREIIKINYDDTYVEGDIEIPCMFSVVISPFDKIPEEFDLQNSYKRRTRRANGWYHSLINMCLNYDGSTKNKILWPIVSFFVRPKWVYKFLVKKATEFSDIDSNLYGRSVYHKSKYIYKDQIFPVVFRKFYDYEIACPNDITNWTEIMTDELKQQIDTIQKADLQLLAEFDRICKKIGIGYFVCGGTMLGQVRHGGFIPWDDDIDVALLRKDYDIFLRECNMYLDKELFFLQTRESDPEIPYLFSKLRLNNSTYLTKYNERRNFHKGICLDLFPFDVVPDDEVKRIKFANQVLKRSRKHNKIVNIAGPEPEYEYGPKNFEDRFYRWFGRVHRRIYKHLSLDITQKRYLKVATKYNKYFNKPGYTTVASFVPTYTFISIDDLLPYRDVKFENIDAKIPHRAEVFLEMQYGDYMSLPPKHQQIGHGLIGWSLDN